MNNLDNERDCFGKSLFLYRFVENLILFIHFKTQKTMKKIKIFAAVAIAALSVGVFISANGGTAAVAASALLQNQVEALGDCEASVICPGGKKISCDVQGHAGGTCSYGTYWVECSVWDINIKTRAEC